jgi:hypothetical protein
VQPIISKKIAINFLASSIPDAEWFLRLIETQDGYFRFPPLLSSRIKDLKIESYPRLYESEASIAGMLFEAFLGPSGTQEFCIDFDTADLRERGQMLEQWSEMLDDFVGSVEIPKTKADQEKATAQFNALSKVEQAEAIVFAQRWYCFFFASFFQNISVMVHGEKLTALVARARTGDDDAFVKAIQIDNRILTTIPYFKDRLSRAQDEYRIQCAPYRGKIRFKSLWLAFAFLDQVGLLRSLPHWELLQICDEAGVGGVENRIQDVKYFTKRLADYRRAQSIGVLSTP